MAGLGLRLVRLDRPRFGEWRRTGMVRGGGGGGGGGGRRGCIGW